MNNFQIVVQFSLTDIKIKIKLWISEVYLNRDCQSHRKGKRLGENLKIFENLLFELNLKLYRLGYNFLHFFKNLYTYGFQIR